MVVTRAGSSRHEGATRSTRPYGRAGKREEVGMRDCPDRSGDLGLESCVRAAYVNGERKDGSACRKLRVRENCNRVCCLVPGPFLVGPCLRPFPPPLLQKLPLQARHRCRPPWVVRPHTWQPKGHPETSNAEIPRHSWGSTPYQPGGSLGGSCDSSPDNNLLASPTNASIAVPKVATAAALTGRDDEWQEWWTRIHDQNIHRNWETKWRWIR
jgi:hypothetical protein